MTLVRFADDMNQEWHRIDKSDIVESFVNDSLRIVNDNDVKKFSIKSGIKKTVLCGDDMEGIVSNSDYAETYMGDYIRIDDIDDEDIYFDDSTDVFFNGKDIQGWETDEYYWYFDGSNWRMREISEKKEFKAECIESENYNTGTIETYKLEDGSIFKIDNSMYQGSLDSVIDRYTEVIDNAKGVMI